MSEGKKEVQVSAVMTAPRYECTWARTHIQKALSEVGIPLKVSNGVFYGQLMQKMLAELVDLGHVDYALTVDFDSVFVADDVRRLLSIIVQEDEIDALAPLQSQRGRNKILASMKEAKEVEWSGYPIKVMTAHFGLTLIDLKKLATVPKPWFCHVPDDEGGWGEGRLDDDVYFWRQWEKAGLTCYLDAGVRLGHLEEMVTRFDTSGQLEHVYPGDWAKEHYGN